MNKFNNENHNAIIFIAPTSDTIANRHRIVDSIHTVCDIVCAIELN